MYRKIWGETGLFGPTGSVVDNTVVNFTNEYNKHRCTIRVCSNIELRLKRNLVSFAFDCLSKFYNSVSLMDN